jgi:Na+-driven multidrug efflux pump
LIRESGSVHLELRQLRIHKLRLKQILQVGLPAGLQSVVFALSNVVIQSAVNSFGEVVVAGNSASHNMEQMIYTCMNSFYQAVISFVSQNLGAGNYQRIWRSTVTGILCVLAIGIPLATLARFFAPQLLLIYSSSPDVIAAGVNRASIMLLFYATAGVMEVVAGAVRGIGYSVMPMLVSLVGACGLRLIWISTIFQIPAYHTISTVYWSYPISWALTLLAHSVCFLWGMRQLKARLAPT